MPSEINDKNLTTLIRPRYVIKSNNFLKKLFFFLLNLDLKKSLSQVKWDMVGNASKYIQVLGWQLVTESYSRSLPSEEFDVDELQEQATEVRWVTRSATELT